MWTSNRSCRSHWTERERRPHELTHVTRPGRNIVSGIHDACFTGGGPSNVIYILADDAGINEFGVSVGQLIDTPNIDRMAQEGMLFSSHYAGSPVSVPSRTVPMTGLHMGKVLLPGNPEERLHYSHDPIMDDSFSLEENGYYGDPQVADCLTQVGIEFIRQNRTQPFFCARPIGMCTNPMWQSRPW